MKSFLLAALALTSLAINGCQSQEDNPEPNKLVGSWALTRLECYCPPNTPTPEETITFDADGNVTVYVKGQVSQTGTYKLGYGSTQCAEKADLVTFDWSGFQPTASYTIDKDVLVIDQGLCFDAPRKTYKPIASSTAK